MLNQTTSVAGRVLRQFSHDKRFIAFSLVVPIVIIGMMWIFFEAAENPFFQVDKFIPPVSAFSIHFLTYVLCAIVLVRERTSETLVRMFVSGYRRFSIIAGYVLAYTLLATLQSLIVLVEIRVLFELDYTSQMWLGLYLVIWLLSITSISLGIFVSNFARNEGQVLPFIPLMLMPSVFFSGMIVSVDRLPDWIAWLRFTTPMFYANEAIQSVIAEDGVIKALFLVAYGTLIMALAILTLREVED